MNKSHGQGSTKKTTSGKCVGCGGTGHFVECKDIKSDIKPEKVVHNERISLITAKEDPVLSKMKRRGWYMASGCTVHVCNSRDMFVDYHPLSGHEVILDFAIDSHVEVAGIGSVVLQFTTGKVLTLLNVFHMPTIRRCLLSPGKLVEAGYEVVIHCASGATIEKNQEIVGKGYIEDGLVRMSITKPGSEPPKVVHNEVIGLITTEDPALINMRRRGWYLASRCTVHVCNSRDMFVDYHPWSGHEVILDNNNHVDVAGIGTVVLRLATGKVLTLTNVFHIPAIIKCLLCIWKLGAGFQISVDADGATIIENNETVGKAYDEDGGLLRLSIME